MGDSQTGRLGYNTIKINCRLWDNIIGKVYRISILFCFILKILIITILFYFVYNIGLFCLKIQRKDYTLSEAARYLL